MPCSRMPVVWTLSRSRYQSSKISPSRAAIRAAETSPLSGIRAGRPMRLSQNSIGPTRNLASRVSLFVDCRYLSSTRSVRRVRNNAQRAVAAWVNAAWPSCLPEHSRPAPKRNPVGDKARRRDWPPHADPGGGSSSSSASILLVMSSTRLRVAYNHFRGLYGNGAQLTQKTTLC
jgi:hypothetical protein